MDNTYKEELLSWTWHQQVEHFLNPVDKGSRINNNLPRFFIPSEKIQLFYSWFVDNIENIEDIFPIYNEYYITIEAKDLLKIHKPTLLNTASFNNISDLQDAIRLTNKVEEILSYLYLHIIHKNNKTLIELYDNAGRLITTNTIKEIKSSDGFYNNQDILNILKRTDYSVLSDLVIEISLIGYFEIEENFKNLIKSFLYICIMLFISSNYYIKQYRKKADITLEQFKEQLQKEYKVYPPINLQKYKVLTKPFYDIGKLDLRTVKNSNNTEHSSPNHAFRVQGHWRHYKSGKVVFIESYIKCKDKGNLINDVIVKPRKREVI